LAPLFEAPNSSPLQAINRIVLFGRNPKLIRTLTASKTVIKPPPSSFAPVYDPVSQESMCPPAKIIYSGYYEPKKSPKRFEEFYPGTI